MATRESQARRMEIKKNSVSRDKVECIPDCWEHYVKSFCDAYILEDSQRRAAEKVLHGCREKAVRKLESMPELRPLYKELVEQRGTNERWFSKAHTFAANNMESLKPVKEIFTDDLQPRLFKIPTRQQIEKSAEPEKLKERKSSG